MPRTEESGLVEERLVCPAVNKERCNLLISFLANRIEIIFPVHLLDNKIDFRNIKFSLILKFLIARQTIANRQFSQI